MLHRAWTELNIIRLKGVILTDELDRMLHDYMRPNHYGTSLHESIQNPRYRFIIETGIPRKCTQNP